MPYREKASLEDPVKKDVKSGNPTERRVRGRRWMTYSGMVLTAENEVEKKNGFE